MPTLRCPVCKKAIEPSDRFCSACGTKISAPGAEAKPEQRREPAKVAQTAASLPASPSISPTSKANEASTWHTYKNAWYGFVIEKPTSWQVRMMNDTVVVSPDADDIIGVSMRLLPLKEAFSAERVARSLVGALSKVISSLKAWRVSAEAGQPEDKNLLVMRIEGVYKTVAIIGVLTIQVYEQVALISGFQAPAKQSKQFSPTMQRILASLKFIDPMQRKHYVDSSEGAYSGYVPADWTVKAQLRRTQTQEAFPLPDFQASDPSGTSFLRIPPSLEQYTEMPMMGNMFSPVRFAPCVPATEYLKRVLLPRLSKQYANMHVENIQPQPGLAQIAMQKAAQSGGPDLGFSCEVASAEYTFEQQGARYREQVFVQIDRVRSVASWMAKITCICHAPVERFEEMGAIFLGIVEALQPNPQWERGELQRANQQLGQAYGRYKQANEDYAKGMLDLQAEQIQLGRKMADGAKRRGEEFLRVQQDYVAPLIRGNEIVVNPANGDRYEVPLGFGAYWASPAGQVYAGRAGDGAPRVGLDRLEPI